MPFTAATVVSAPDAKLDAAADEYLAAGLARLLERRLR
jgi:hypothetical protein